jgi:hypothetical protein
MTFTGGQVLHRNANWQVSCNDRAPGYMTVVVEY